ncbi:phospholipase D family protein [Cognatishimia sp. SS12]|uniref:phospholipase D family protein n=1 Tax=Cognatishimia sp. SS12 TaxID=2979465 RepID=UPI00232F3EBB|nr:phospholipase D family protein [Cognatishimia sp. SS12]MDC0737845.1 phospholipase D family protein [Cognatishimia sp. SS12]
MQSDFTVLVTAEEAFPAFERAVLGARAHIIAGFRIFDMRTKLRSPEAQKIGETWFDLLAYVVGKGVRFDLVVSDFDPDMASDLHRTAAQTVQQGRDLAKATGADDNQLRVRSHLHPARAGLLPRLFFAPAALRYRRKYQDDGEAQTSGLPELHTVSHHQKVAVIDDEILYAGGLDLNERRFDTKDHELPAHLSWSDVQVIARGPAARETRLHLESFEDVVAGKAAPSPARHLMRTLSTPRKVQIPFLSPRTLLREIEQAHIDAFRNARHLIHIETQFLRSAPIAEALAKAAETNPHLRAIIVLPGTPMELAYEEHTGLDVRYGLAQARSALDRLRDSLGERLLLCAPVRPVMAARETRATLAGSPLIHVHNKVLVKDRDYVLIGSANLNGRSMRWDTELAIATTDPAAVDAARRKLAQHWWFDPLPDVARDPETAFDWWKDRIIKNGHMLPEKRSGYLVPYDLTANAELEQPLPGVTEDIV